MLRTYRLFGLRLRTEFPFAFYLETEKEMETAAEPSSIPFSVTPEPPFHWRAEEHTPVYESPFRGEGGETILRLYHLEECDILSFTEGVDFYLFSHNLVAHSPKGPFEHCSTLTEIRFLGPVLAFWLERQGLPVLHASAVVRGGRAIGFLGANKGGKTSLAAALLRSGMALLTDDLLVLDHQAPGRLVRPGYPQMRMWPPLAKFFLGAIEELPRVHPALSKRRVQVGEGSRLGTFCSQPQPLECLYLLQRQPAGAKTVEIEPVSPRDAVIELVRYSFLPTLAAGLGWEGRRLAGLSRLSGEVPLKRLIYPSGFDQLERVAAAVAADIGR